MPRQRLVASKLRVELGDTHDVAVNVVAEVLIRAIGKAFSFLIE
ncbi:MAG: hypothetical protein ACLTSL_08005 [Odoribacter splanchnicus]